MELSDTRKAKWKRGNFWINIIMSLIIVIDDTIFRFWFRKFIRIKRYYITTRKKRNYHVIMDKLL